MRRRTSTTQIQNAIKSNHLHLIKAETYNKNTRKTEAITNDEFLESFDFICESGFFADCIGWSFGRNSKTGQYEIEAGRMDSNSDAIVTAYFRRVDGVNAEDIDEMLLKVEEGE